MNKKAIFFDVDGTLIDRQDNIHEATEKTKEIIRRMNDLGHYPIVSTGRPMCMINENIRSIGFKNFLSSGGNYVVINGEVIYSCEMNKERLKKALEDAIELGLALYFENNEKCFVSPRVKNKMLFDFMDRVGVDIFEITEDINDVPIYKANLLWKNKRAFDLFHKKYKDEFNFAVFAGNNGSTDMIAKGSSKATGATKVLETLNIDIKDAYAIGDSHNDVEIIQMVGHGIAMGNGVDEVKRVAEVVTKSVKEEGIFEAFKDMEWLK